ncbi:efflux RND transporter permease subunit [Defluviimonas sp. D31]|uniref:efflux RND transporter permease subunit n=1 Tax=Defluviimonas sp. D31 TaxID=3083253 RepID=UPI00296F55E1|nr:efflux RND transporter permease subunit [Defluviimonas sp. D31]MDW4547893.1 efflux RND transporter permease subunit [Defluviimonas sp. D31]
MRFRYIVIALAAMLVIFGAQRTNDLRVDVFPEFAPPLVEIQTPSLGLTSIEVEEYITIPLEQGLAGIAGLDIIRSKSAPQLSSIVMIFTRDTDLLRARQLVQERVNEISATLPTWSSPPVILPPLSATSRIMKIGLSSEKYSLIDMSMTTYWKIRERLLRVPGVANVAIWGERLEMMQVQVDPARLAENGVTLDTVMESTADALDVGLLRYSDGARVGTGGFIDTDTNRYPIHHVLPIHTIDDLKKVSVTGTDKTLADVADVKIDHQPLIGDAVINDGPGLLLIVEKFPWANTLDVSLNVEEAIDKMRPGLQDIEIDTEIFRPATFIETSIDNLSKALLVAAVLVTLVLWVFLFDWRIALISIVAVPVSLLGALLVLDWQGMTINTMVLAGFAIALGAVVDDAIIDVENIVRRLRENRAKNLGRSTFRVILEASLEIRAAIVFATAIIVLAVVPVFFLEGLSGSFFRPLAWSYAVALMASLVVAVTITPALSYVLLGNRDIGDKPAPLARFLVAGYRRMLDAIFAVPRLTVTTCVVLLGACFTLLPFMGQQLLPSFKERDFLMHWVTAPGVSQPEMYRITVQGSKELRDIEGVRNFGAHIGQALYMDEVVGMHFGENWVSVDPAADYDATLDRIQEVVDGYPGLYRDVLTYLKERIREVLTGESEPIVIRIFGPDFEGIREQADRVAEAIGGVEGLVGLHVGLQKNVPQIDIRTDVAKAASYGLKPGDVRRAVSTIISGIEAGDIHTHARTYDVQVWGTPEVRASLTDIENILIDAPIGGQVALKEVADIAVTPTPNIIQHEDLSRSIEVGAHVSGRDLGSVASEVEDIVEEMEFPLGYHFEMLGEFAELQASQTRLIAVEIAVALGIFALLHASFRSVRYAAVAFAAMPAALAGGVVAAWLGGGIFSLGSLVGFITVLGIAARNNILMISHCQRLGEEGMPFGPERVSQAACERLAPILMTAITTGAALLPLVVAGEIPGHEIEFPMAVVILGGLVSSTLVNLLIMPVLILWFGAAAEREALAATGEASAGGWAGAH